MKYCCMALLSVFAFAGCDEPHYEVPVQTLRQRHVRSIIADMNNGQFLGGADSAIEGGDKLFESIIKFSKETLPDGKYVVHRTGDGRREIDGYEYWGRYYRVYVYKLKATSD